MFLEYISNFVVKFLDSNKADDELIKLWKSHKTQQALFKTVRKTILGVADPEKPKRGKSAFLYFCDENRSKVKEEFPKLTVKQIVSKLGALWQELKINNLNEVAKFEAMSLTDRNRYKEEMKSYVPILNRKYETITKTDSDETELILKKEIKRSSGPYHNYFRSKRVKTKKQHPELDSEGVKQYLDRKWNKLPNERREKYKTSRSKKKTKIEDEI